MPTDILERVLSEIDSYLYKDSDIEKVKWGDPSQEIRSRFPNLGRLDTASLQSQSSTSSAVPSKFRDYSQDGDHTGERGAKFFDTRTMDDSDDSDTGEKEVSVVSPSSSEPSTSREYVHGTLTPPSDDTPSYPSSTAPGATPFPKHAGEHLDETPARSRVVGHTEDYTPEPEWDEDFLMEKLQSWRRMGNESRQIKFEQLPRRTQANIKTLNSKKGTERFDFMDELDKKGQLEDTFGHIDVGLMEAYAYSSELKDKNYIPKMRDLIELESIIKSLIKLG